MPRRTWFKVHHHLLHDISFAAIARKTEQPRAVVLGLWILLLDHAQRQSAPGSVAEVDREDLSLMLDLAPETVATLIRHFHERKLIDRHQRIVGWDRYQGTSTPRVRAHRTRKAVKAGTSDRRIAPPLPAARPKGEDHPETVAARRDRLQQNNRLIIGTHTSPGRPPP